MKKMIALLLTLMMSLSLLIPVFAEETEPVAGGWAANADDPRRGVRSLQQSYGGACGL